MILSKTSPCGSFSKFLILASKFEQNKALVEFFRSVPPHKLELVLLGKPKYRTTRTEWLDLTPVIDGDFLPKPIEDLRKEVPKKQIMTGVTKCEGLLFGKARFIYPIPL